MRALLWIYTAITKSLNSPITNCLPSVTAITAIRNL